MTKKILGVMFFVLMGLSAQAQLHHFSKQSGENTLYYYINDSIKPGMAAGKVTLVSELNRPSKDNKFYYNVAPKGTLIIPDKINHDGVDYIVNRINTVAFADCEELTGNLTIPNSVTFIGNDAFKGCSDITDLTLGDKIDYIGRNTFASCRNLTQIKLTKDNPPKIEPSTFYYSPILYAYVPCFSSSEYEEQWRKQRFKIKEYREFTVEANSSSSYGSADLYYWPCNGSKPALITAIPNIGYKFEKWSDGDTNNPRTANITQDTVFTAQFKIVKQYHFSSLSENNTLYYRIIDSATTTIHGAVTLVSELVVDTSLDSLFYHNPPTGKLTIPNEVMHEGKTYVVTDISEYAFSFCKDLTGHLTIPESVTRIEKYAFSNCIGFTGNLNISNALTKIENNTFESCQNFIGDLNIPQLVTEIGGSAFLGCSGFTSLTIPQLVTEIGDSAFFGCSGFTGNLIIPESLTHVGVYAFYECRGFTGDLNIPNSLTSINSRVFDRCFGLNGQLTIPNTVEGIGEFTFARCNFTGDLIIPNSVVSIGMFAFYSSGFTGNLTIPDSLKRIGASIFARCNFIGDLTIPDFVISIENKAFLYCSNLNGSLIIPNTVEVIGESAFAGCNMISNIHLSSDTPVETDSTTFEYISLEIPVIIPCGSKKAYMLADTWGKFDNYQENDEHLFLVKSSDNLQGSTNVDTAPCATNNIAVFKAIPRLNYKFKQWSDRNPNNPRTATIISDTVFVAEFSSTLRPRYDFTAISGTNTLYYRIIDTAESDNRARVEVVSELDPTKGDYTSYNVMPSGTLIIPEQVVHNGINYAVEKIGKDAFVGCINLKGSLTIPNSVIVIDDGSFAFCDSLRGRLTLSESLISIGERAFAHSYFTDSLVIPNSVISIGSSAFGYSAGFGSLTLSNSLKEIGDAAFAMCTGFTGSLTIPNSVTSIEERAFSFDNDGLSQFSALFVSWQVPLSIDISVFVGFPIDIPVIIPCGLKSTYKLADVWSRFSDYQENDEYLFLVKSNNVDYGSINVISNLCNRNVAIFEAIPTEGSKFEKWSDGDTSNPRTATITQDTVFFAEFTNVNYDFTAKSGSNTLYYRILSDRTSEGLICVALVSEIKDKTHNYESRPTGTLIIPEKVIHNGANYEVTEIGSYAFAHCIDLEGALSIPNTITAIGDYAFFMCKNITYVRAFYQKPPLISLMIFKGINNGSNFPLFIPCGTKSEYEDKWSPYLNYLENSQYLFFVASQEEGEITITRTPCDNGTAIFEAKPANYTDYVFSHWSDGNTDNPRTIAVTQDTIIVAEYMKKSYFIAYHANGASGTMESQAIPIGTREKLNSNTFTKKDHIFLGWARGVSDAVSFQNNDSVYNLSTTMDTIHLYAIWDAVDVYTVKFHANGSSGTMGNQKFYMDIEQNLNPHSFEKNGYSFQGWAKDINEASIFQDNELVENLSIINNDTVSLYAVWRANTYIVQFYPNSGDGRMANQVFAVDIAEKLNVNTFTKEGCGFLGWAKDVSSVVSYQDNELVKNQSFKDMDTINLYAVWKPIGNYAVKFHTNGGDGSMKEQIFSIGIAQKLDKGTFSMDNAEFLGWADSAESAVVQYKEQEEVKDLSTVDKDIVSLYAVWKQEIEALQKAYTVTFNANGGNGTMSNQEFDMDIYQNLKANTFEKESSSFLGWAKNSNETVSFYNTQLVRNLSLIDEDIVNLYAVWEVSTDIAELKEIQFSLYPNPVINILYIENYSPDTQRFVILNSLGKVEMIQTSTGNKLETIQVSHLKPGIYIIQVYAGDGLLGSAKFIKEDS